MSKLEIPVPKTHASGSWRVVRSMAVPANVTPANSDESLTAHRSGIRQAKKSEEVTVNLKARKAPGYYETADPSFSKS